MRLDKYLKVSRIIKRRSVSNEACDAGRVMLNGKPAKAGAAVKVGDIVSVRFGERLTQYEVVTLSEHVLKQDAQGMYRIIP
ncbi:RNA-binding S4 domain-containing protein [Eubacteriales bacterium OttesenSCG-928-N13]|nr:RNA-binding S4 domain-containing protein [Eubacteriales bacterium OttesenSCG-928-N13]